MAEKEGLKVLVIGAGSTGLLLAQGLKQVTLTILYSQLPVQIFAKTVLCLAGNPMRSIRARGALFLPNKAERMGHDPSLGPSLHKQMHPTRTSSQVQRNQL